MKTKSTKTVWAATFAALLILAFPAYWQWKKEYGPPTEATLQLRELLKNVDEVRVYDSKLSLVPRPNDGFLFVLKKDEAKYLIEAIDFTPPPRNGIIFNLMSSGTHLFKFVTGTQVTAHIRFDYRDDSFPSINPQPSKRGLSRKRMRNYFHQVVRDYDTAIK